MALPGNQTNQGPISYNAGNNSWRDLNLNASETSWPSNTFDMARTGQCGNPALFVSSSSNQQSADTKEIIKHAMLKQDTEFQNQIHELHRVYKRQVELMNEKKEDIFKWRLQMLSSQANSYMCQTSINNALKQWGTPNLPSLKLPENHLAAESPIYSAPISGSSKDSECTKTGKRVLDLQLPAEAYLDFEEEKSLPRKFISRPCFEAAGSSSVSQVSDPHPSKNEIMFDLNAPFVLEEDMNPKLSDIREPVNQEIFVENTFTPGEDIEPKQGFVQLPKSGISHESNPPLSDISTSKPEDPLKKPALILSPNNPVHERPGIRKILLALPCLKNCKKIGNRYVPTMEGLGPVESMKNTTEKKSKSLSGSEDRENTEKSGVVDLNSDSGVGLLDLNSSANDNDENESSPAALQDKQSGVCDSVENQAVTSGHPEEDLEYITSKTLVDMSSSQIGNYQVNEIPWLQPLYWFADIVCSEAGNHSPEESPLDDFKAMTLQLKEANEEVQEDENPNPLLQSLNEPRKVQRRSARRQRKNFQTEILPSLASLSGYEATDDFQMTGVVVEESAANQGKRMLTRGRKRSYDLLSKQQVDDSQRDTKERSVVDWGRIQKRRRSLRRPVN